MASRNRGRAPSWGLLVGLAGLLLQPACRRSASCQVDLDGDGYVSAASCATGTDCDDLDPDVHPGAQELCDGVDNDCDGFVDDVLVDADGDGWIDANCEAGTDCDDLDPSIHPGAEELCNGVDDDCNGLVDDRDMDGDGYVDAACEGGDDCDDSDAHVNPGAREDCDNGIDDDCDGSIDRQDTDGDGQVSTDCGGLDCDDADPTSYAGATELCDEVDHDCDGEVHDVDADGDGSYDPDCGGDDCDDSDPGIHPGAVDYCGDGIDQDCDGVVDFEDADGDGVESERCGGEDCDDHEPAVAGGFEEVCGDGLDNDCSGEPDDRDADGDGHVDEACGGDDCDDSDWDTSPSAPEYCDAVDSDCDSVTWDVDRDGDGDRDEACGGGDCNDALPNVYSGAAELCDGLDNDCDGVADVCTQRLPGGLDFSTYTASDWSLDGDWSFADDALLFRSRGDGQLRCARYVAHTFSAPYRVEVDISRAGDAKELSAGLLVVDPHTYEGAYAFIRSNGKRATHELGTYDWGSLNTLTGRDDDPHVAMADDLPNRIALEHDGSLANLYVNGELVVTRHMDSYDQGQLWLCVQDSGDPGLEVRFDDVYAED